MTQVPTPIDFRTRVKNSVLLPALVAAILAIVLAFVIRPEGSGLVVWYRKFAEIFGRGTSPLPGGEYPTFPMWGYGFLLSYISNVTLLTLLQIGVGLTGVLCLMFSLLAAGKLQRSSVVLGMWIVAFFLPWHSAGASAYSAPAVATGLMLVSLGFLIRYLAFGKRICILAAAVSYGVCLNFRSDYCVFSAVIAGVICLAARRWQKGLLDASLWLIVIGIFMAPWAIYTQRATGHAQLTSSNTGHVLYLSWGDLPSNPWGIQVSDDDPVMIADLKQHYGYPVSSLSTEGDRYLRRRFFEMVREQPWCYIRRTGLQIRNLLLGGFAPGVWDRDFRQHVRDRFPTQNLNWILLHEGRTLLGWVTAGTAIAIVAEVQGRIGLIVGLVLSFLAMNRAIRTREYVFLLLALVVAYQMALSVVIHYIRPPLNNEILPLLCLGLWWIKKRNDSLDSSRA